VPPVPSSCVRRANETRLLWSGKNPNLIPYPFAAAVRANARMRMRVLSRASLGGKSVPVGSAKDENKHFEEAERENYRRHGPRARAAFAAHSNNCI
jgi:hypothetical protein